MSSAGTKKTGRFSGIGVSIVGLLFFGAGLLMGYFQVVLDLNDWNAARHYVPVTAQLIHVELKQHQNSEGGTTYRVQANYTYTYEGQSFNGTRVSISETADNIGDHQRKLYRRLNAKKGAPVTAWIDPIDPRRALLDREMRWGLFAFKSTFAAVFLLIGGVLIILPWRTSRTTMDAAVPIVPRHSGTITSNSRSAMFFWWGFAVLWNLISLPGLFFLLPELKKGNSPALLILLFPLAGTWLLYKAVVATLHWRRFGTLALTLNPHPAVIGSAIRGTLELPERLSAQQNIKVTITCLRRRRTGRDRDTADRALWQNETLAQIYAAGRGTQLSFGFNLPPDLPPSGVPSDDYVIWTLHLDADLPGVDLDGRFEIPVVQRTPDTPAIEPVPALTTVSTVPPEIPARVVLIKNERGVMVFHYPLFRNLGMSITVLSFGLICIVPVILMTKALRGSLFDAMLWLMIIIFSLVGGLLTILGLYLFGNTLRVEVSPAGITTVRRVFGLPIKQVVPRTDIKSVETKIGSQSNNSGKMHVRYSLIAHVAGRKKPVTVGEDLPGSVLADHVAEMLRRACGTR